MRNGFLRKVRTPLCNFAREEANLEMRYAAMYGHSTETTQLFQSNEFAMSLEERDLMKRLSWLVQLVRGIVEC